MNSNPKLSIIIPMYNVEKYLSRCLDSIISNDFKDYEILLIDDGSQDSTYEIAKKYAESDKRIKLFKIANDGVSAARNLGIENMKGEYCFFVDSDDWIDNDFLERLISAQNGFKADLLIYGFYINDDKQELFNRDNLSSEEFLMSIADTKSNCGSALWNKLFVSELIGKNIRFDATAAIGEDMLFLCEYVLKAKHITAIDEAGYHYFMRDDSAMKGVSKRFLTGIDAYKKLDKLFEKEHVNIKIRNAFKVRNAAFCYEYLIRAAKTQSKEYEVIEGFKKVIREDYDILMKSGAVEGKRKLLVWPMSHGKMFFKAFSKIANKIL